MWDVLKSKTNCSTMFQAKKMVAGDERLRKTERLRGLSVNALQLHAGLF